MGERAKEVIPKDVQEAAKGTDAKIPIWYAGRRHREVKITKGLGEVVAKAREEAGLSPPELIDTAANEEISADD